MFLSVEASLKKLRTSYIDIVNSPQTCRYENSLTRYTAVPPLVGPHRTDRGSNNVFPIIGGRKKSHLDGNIAALSLKLSSEDIEKIDEAYPFDTGFPLNFLFMGQKTPSRRGEDVWLTSMATHIKTVDRPKPIVVNEL
jgi:hypothetical protein